MNCNSLFKRFIFQLDDGIPVVYKTIKKYSCFVEIYIDIFVKKQKCSHLQTFTIVSYRKVMFFLIPCFWYQLWNVLISLDTFYGKLFLLPSVHRIQKEHCISYQQTFWGWYHLHSAKWFIVCFLIQIYTQSGNNHSKKLYKTTMVVIIFCDFSIFLSNFSFAVREIGVIVGNRNEIFELPQKLPNELRLVILGN